MAVDAPANGCSPLEVMGRESAANVLPPLEALALDAPAYGLSPLEAMGRKAAAKVLPPLEVMGLDAPVNGRSPLEVMGRNAAAGRGKPLAFEPTWADVERRRVNPAGCPEPHAIMPPCSMPNASAGMPRHVTPAVDVVLLCPMSRGDHDRPRRMPMHHPVAVVPVEGAEGELRGHAAPGTPQDADMRPRARHHQGPGRQRIGMDRRQPLVGLGRMKRR
ncbi:hypothetical protein MKP05_13720 [Halomonas sp. EGI 63088]|uniref:Uncharacterized protein n=1 Tax=Halomonas flagellata TaxID=2920385 RepID=A0ABS9RWE0_9GAMM|nr:hypothetical protein [Halomonas flagellata]MCH4564170.1 hypothetical protein [Halomonas flagellata]